MVVMRLLSELKGISPWRGYCFSTSVLCIPLFAPTTINAPSVGSPVMFVPSKVALLHNTPIFNSKARWGSSAGLMAVPSR